MQSSCHRRTRASGRHLRGSMALLVSLYLLAFATASCVQPTGAGLSVSIVIPTSTPVVAPTATPTLVPLPTPDGVSRTLTVPILMYHYVSTPPDPNDSLRVDLSVTPAQFASHLAYLTENGYETINLYDLALALQTGAPLPERPIILTFDDGYADHFTNACPLLQQYGCTGTFFLVTGFIDAGEPAYLTWDQVTKMRQAGMSVEPHSYDHTDLRDRSIEYLVWETLGPKEAIEARTGEPVRFFCYPSGKYDDRLIEVLESEGYWGAVSTEQGAEHCSADMFRLQRIRVRGSYDAEDLAAILDYYAR